MQRFAELYIELDRCRRTADKQAALVNYFRSAPPRDAAWALALLAGKRKVRPLKSGLLRQWACRQSGLAEWLLEECYELVGDLSETLALLLPEHHPADIPLHEVIENRLLPLEHLDETRQHEVLLQCWSQFSTAQRFTLHKLLSRNFRGRVSEQIVARALAEGAGIDAATMAHRLSRPWQPSAGAFNELLSSTPINSDIGCPYPFCFPHVLVDDCAKLGPLQDWIVEWKWDGMRAQLIKRRDQVLLWSDDGQHLTESYPAIASAGAALPNGTVIDGVIVGECRDRVGEMGAKRRAAQRGQPESMLWNEECAVLMTFDLLEVRGEDLCKRPLSKRRKFLEQFLDQTPRHTALQLAPLLSIRDWADVRNYRARARQERAGGVLLKHRGSHYEAGGRGSGWWSWKATPLQVDAVLMYARQDGEADGDSFEDFTFGVWQAGELVAVATVPPGLGAQQTERLHRFVSEHTTQRRGPVHMIPPTQVFRLAFDNAQSSPRRKSGMQLKSAAMELWYADKPPGEAGTLEALQALIRPAVGGA